MPRVDRTWLRNMVPHLPAAIRPTVTGRPAASRRSSMECRFTAFSSLLAHGAGDENLGRAFRAGWRAALEQEARRGALLLALSIEALAGLETLAAAERHSSRQTVRRAVRGFHAPLPRIYDPGIGQRHHLSRCLLRGFSSLRRLAFLL